MRRVLTESDLRMVIRGVLNEVFSLLNQVRHPIETYRIPQELLDARKKKSNDYVKKIDEYIKELDTTDDKFGVIKNMINIVNRMNRDAVVHDREMPNVGMPTGKKPSREFLNTRQRNELDALYQVKNDCLEKFCIAINSHPECGVKAIISQDEFDRRVMYFMRSDRYNRDLEHSEIRNRAESSFHINSPNNELSQHGIIIHRPLVTRSNDNKKWVYDDERQTYFKPEKENPYKDCEMTPFNERVSIMKMPNGKYTLANNETHKPFYDTPNQMFDDFENYNGELCLTREEDGKIYVYSIKAPLKGTVPPVSKKNVVDVISESRRYFYR